MTAILLTILGLVAFEIINSVDNAVVDAEVLGKTSARAKRWFLVYGMLFGVFCVRGLLPWLILWLSSPGLTAWGAVAASFSNNKEVAEIIEHTKPILLVGAGMFLSLLFLHWLFQEEKSYGLIGERFIHRHGLWFYTVASVVLIIVVKLALGTNPQMALSASIGLGAFFLVNGFKENAERAEAEMISGESKMSDLSKILYLEAIDTCFSIDGVLGAFAFTLSIPLIILGNGIGAVVVRQLTVGNIERVKRLPYLKNGAMYSIGSLAVIMFIEAFGGHVPTWVSPVITFSVIGYFLFKSWLEMEEPAPITE